MLGYIGGDSLPSRAAEPLNCQGNSFENLRVNQTHTDCLPCYPRGPPIPISLEAMSATFRPSNPPPIHARTRQATGRDVAGGVGASTFSLPGPSSIGVSPKPGLRFYLAPAMLVVLEPSKPPNIQSSRRPRRDTRSVNNQSKTERAKSKTKQN